MYQRIFNKITRRSKHHEKRKTDISSPSELFHFPAHQNSTAIHNKMSVSKDLSWKIQGKLIVTMRKELTDFHMLFDMLYNFVEDYTGPIIKRPIVLLIYGLLGSQIKQKVTNQTGYFVYESTLDQILSFKILTQEFEDSESSINWNKVFNSGLFWFKINLDLKLIPTRRSGCNFLSVYQNGLQNHHSPKLSEIITLFEIPADLSDTNLQVNL